MGLYQLSAFAAFAALATPAAALLSNSSINSQVRSAFSSSTGMVVSWNTFQQLSNPTVKYGLSPDALTMTASSTVSVTYQSSLTYNNHVKLSGLKPDTLYYFAPASLNANETSPAPYTFKTAKAAGDLAPYTVAFVADLGTMGPEGLSTTSGKGVDPEGILKPGEINTIQSLTAGMADYDFLIHGGDIAYADAWYKEEQAGYEPKTSLADGYKVYESILNGFYDDMMHVTAFKPYMVAVGNHEANCDNGSPNTTFCVPGQTNFTGYRNHFRMPSDVSGGLENFWYSYDYGMVHYVVFNTETDLGNGLLGPDEPPSSENSGPFGTNNQQINWLNSDLSSVDRCKTPWVIAIGHRPWFASGSNCANCSLAFGPLFEKYGVDMVLQGHFHVYERNLPVYANGTVDPKGYNNPSTPWYVINGIAGHYDGMDNFTAPLQKYQAYGIDARNQTYGWSRIHFYNQTHMKHEFVASQNQSVLDSTVLFKNHTVCAASGSTTTTSAASMVTSTVRTTTVMTVTKCPATVTACPASLASTTVVTSTIDLYTTVCPASATPTTIKATTTAVGSATPSGIGSGATTAPASGSAKASGPASGATTVPASGSGKASATTASTATTSKPAVVTAGASRAYGAAAGWAVIALAAFL